VSKYIGAIDQGTKSTRFVIFDKTGHIVASHREVHKEISIKPGWVEHDPLVLWMRTQSAIKKAMEKGRVKASDLAAIGVTNQRETTLIWNKDTGKPYGNAIVWQDTRTKDICAKLALEARTAQWSISTRRFRFSTPTARRLQQLPTTNMTEAHSSSNTADSATSGACRAIALTMKASRLTAIPQPAS